MPVTRTSPARGERRDACGDVDRDAGQAVPVDFDLTGVHAGSDLESQLSHGFADPQGASQRPGRPVERCEEPVAGRIDLATAEPFEGLSHLGVVPAQELFAKRDRRASTARSVEPTMSVKSIVVSTRFDRHRRRVPVAKLSISSTRPSESPAKNT